MTVNKKKTNQRPSAIQDVFMRLGILGEILSFLWKRKLYWLIPLMVTLLVFALLIVVGSAGPGGAFIYTLF
jgi:hypothetical protein